MNTEIENAVNAADMDAQYDEKAKRLLGNKIILSHILAKTVDEFKGMRPEDIMPYIEGDPFIGAVPADPGLTNTEAVKGGLGLLNIVMIGISRELPEHAQQHELHRLLGILLSMELSVDERLGMIETEYPIPADDRIRKDVGAMCNLSQGIREKGRAEGEAKGRVEGETKFILNMHRKGYTPEQIAEIVEKGIEEVEAIIEKSEPVFA